MLYDMSMQNSMVLCTLNFHLDGEDNEENLPSYVNQETQSLIQVFYSECCVELKSKPISKNPCYADLRKCIEINKMESNACL